MVTVTPPQDWSVWTIATGGPPGRARNVSPRKGPAADGQEASGAIVDSGRPSMSAPSSRTVAGPGSVTGGGSGAPGRPTGSPLGNSAIVTALAAAGIKVAADRGGCHATHASTRIPACPAPELAASTISSLVIRAPSGASWKARSHAGGPKSASPSVNRNGRGACSHGSPARWL